MKPRAAPALEHHQAFFLYTAFVKVCDALTVWAVWELAWVLRFDASFIPITKGIPSFELYSRATLPLVVVFSAVFHTVGAYKKDRIHFGFRALKKIVQGTLLATLVFISICYFQKSLFYSRIFLLVFFWLALLGISGERLFLEILWRFVQRHFVARLKILLVGEGNLLEMYFRSVELKRPYPVQWIGRLGDPQDSILSKVPYLGNSNNIAEILRNQDVEMVVISFPTEKESKYPPLLEFLSKELIRVKVIPDFGKYSTFTYRGDQEWGIPLLLFNETPAGPSDRFVKRLLDIFISLFVLIFFAPLYLVLALAVKLTSRGPVFYKQQRAGLDGKTFTLYKFRTMRVDAEELSGPVWATEGDSRTTNLGRWLRKTSLDELPQFYNILIGEMTLVGPRPERPVFIEKFRQEYPKYQLRHKMKAGLTGWAQINGLRGNTSLEDRLKYDLYYIDHWSHYFDIKIIVLTLFKGFVNRHAY